MSLGLHLGVAVGIWDLFGLSLAVFGAFGVLLVVFGMTLVSFRQTFGSLWLPLAPSGSLWGPLGLPLALLWISVAVLGGLGLP